MTENNRHGKREAATRKNALRDYWQQHRAWVAGLNRGQKIRYRLFQVLVILALVVICVFAAARAWIRLPEVPTLPTDSTVNTSGDGDVEYDGSELPDVAKSGRKEGYYTFLLAGQDVISGSTDTMILVSYDTKNKEIHAISLLRDTMINTSASSKRLNSVYTRNRGDKSLPEDQRVENGMTALKKEVSKLTGIYPDFYVMVQWEAIGKLVDAIGGVYFEVPFDMDYDDPAQDLHIHQEAGYRLLDGEDAMEVIRFRKNNDFSISLGDSGRTEIQRDFLVAVLKECLQPDVLLKLPTLANIFMENVDTDLSVGNILAFAELAIGMDPENDVTIVSMPWTGVSYNRASMVVANESELLELLNDGINPYVNDIQSSDLQLMYVKSNGGFGVTNATLADPSMGYVYVAPDPVPDDTQTEQPTQGEDPDQSGETTDSEDPVLPGDPVNPGTGDTSGETTQPQDPGTSTDPADPSTPSGSDTSTDPTAPTDPVIPGDPVDPGTPSGSTQGGDGGVAAGDPVQPDATVEGTPSQDIPAV